MNEPRTHHCKQGGLGLLVRDASPYDDVPGVWRCIRPCGTYFAVVDGEASDPTATTETS